MKPQTLSPLVLAITAKIEQKITSVAQLTAVLNCSADSLYRRLRGDTDFLHSEAILISNELNISLDALYKLQTGFIQFNTRHLINHDEENAVTAIREYIEKLHKDLSEVDKIGVVQLYYAAKDIPLFNFFSHKDLIPFKLYFWHMVLFSGTSKKVRYDANWLPNDVIEKALSLHKMYNTSPSIEIWNFETINSTLHQIEYCVASGLMQNKDAQLIIEALTQFVHQLEENCEIGRKNNLGKLQMYLNEILILDNSVIFDLGIAKIFYMPYQTLNFFNTTNPAFVDSTIEWMQRQISKSTLISNTGDKDRFRLFKHYHEAIGKCREVIG